MSGSCARTGDVDLASSHDAPVRFHSPALRIERRLVAQQREGHAVGAMTERAHDDTLALAAIEHRPRVATEVGMTLAYVDSDEPVVLGHGGEL